MARKRKEREKFGNISKPRRSEPNMSCQIKLFTQRNGMKW